MASEVKFLLYGATGYIGTHIKDALTKSGSSRGRLEDSQGLIEEIGLVQPTHVVCAAGLKGKPNVLLFLSRDRRRCCDRKDYTMKYDQKLRDWGLTVAQDWFELPENYEEAYRVNVQSQVDIAKFCATHDIHCTLISSGFIYNYDEKHPVGGIGFTEEDEPNYTALIYSKLRVILEKELKPFTSSGSTLLLRINMPLSSTENPANILTKCVRFTSVHNVSNSFSVLDDLCPVLVKLALQKVGGVFNFTNPGRISLADILSIYKEKLNPDHQWSVSEPPKNRPSCYLDTGKLEKQSADKIPDIRSSIERIFDKWEQEKGL